MRLFKCDLFSSPQVVYNVGLCICLYDITKLEDSYIFPGDGASHTKGLMMLTSYFATHVMNCNRNIVTYTDLTSH